MVNWGIIGLGNMANKFADAILEVNNAKLLGVASLNSNRLENFSEKYKIKKDFQFKTYEDLLSNKEINAIYIATLNNTHLKLIINSAKQKKSILCEKPMSLSKNESKEALKNIKKFNVFFMEAIAYRSHPQVKNIIKILKNDGLGEIKSIKSSFGFIVKKVKKDSRLFNKSFGGGAILDIGCYPLSFVSFLNLNNTILFENVTGSFSSTGVDDYAEANLLINNNIKANIKVSFKENLENNSIIFCENGHIVIPSPWLPEKKSYIEVFKKESSYKIFLNLDKSIYAQQISYASDLISNNRLEAEYPGINIDESMKISELLEEWSKKIKV